MEIVLLVFRLILFGVFAVSSITKLLDPEGSEKAMREFGMPAEFTRFFSVALPFAEIVFAICFLFVSMSWVGAAGALLLLVTFTSGMAWQMRQGRAPDCHCFGQIHSEPVGAKSVVRNLIFIALAVVLLAYGRANQGLELASTNSGMLQMLLILILVVLAVVLLGYLVNLTAQQNELMRRLSLLELTSAEPRAVERNEAGDPSDGLPIGAPLPDFAIPDLAGRIIQFEHLLAEPKPFLFLFVGAQCGPCEVLLPEISEWESELSDKLQFVFISHGDPETNRQKFGSESRILLVDKHREFANSVHAKWTPTGLFVDKDGNVASHLAAGDIAIRRLVEQMKSREFNEEFIYFLGLNGHRKPNIGQRIPQFSVKDVNGRELTEKNLAGRKTLVAFTSPTCGHCSTLIEQIREWESGRNGGGPQIIIFSDGNEEAERTHGLSTPIIIDKGYKTAAKFGMRGVPSAVLVNENGIITTEAAIGAGNIWSLIGEQR